MVILELITIALAVELHVLLDGLRAYRLRLLGDVFDVGLVEERHEGPLGKSTRGQLLPAELVFVDVRAARTRREDAPAETEALLAHLAAVYLEDSRDGRSLLELILFECLGLPVGKLAGQGFATDGWPRTSGHVRSEVARLRRGSLAVEACT